MWWENYEKIRFAEKGRGPDLCDCWGLAGLIYKRELNKDLPDYLECYQSTQDKEVLSNLIKKESAARWKSITQPAAFDIIVLNILGLPFHVGIVTKPGWMIHCMKDVNTTHVNYNSLRWKSKVQGFYRHG